MKKPDQKRFWLFSLVAWAVLIACCLLATVGIIPNKTPSVFLYLACIAGLISSAVNLIRNK